MPKMKCSRLMFYSTVLTSVMLSSCSQHAQTHSTVENTASNYAQNAATYWTEQPFCSGRYQINLPVNRKGGTSWIKYNGWQVTMRPDYWNKSVELASKIQKLGHNGSDIFIENRTIVPNKAIAMVTQAPAVWSNPTLPEVNGMLYYVDYRFKLSKNDAYTVRAFVRIMPVNGKEPPNLKQLEKSKVDEAIRYLQNDFFNKMRDRSEGDIPQQQGVCLTEGFIADNRSEPFFGRAGIKIKDYKDVYAELTTGGSLEEGDKPLLERDLFAKDGAWDKLISWAKYSTIRKGKRDINGMTGSEKLVKWQGNRYLFIWEKEDGSVKFKMTFGTNEKDTKGSPLSEKEALSAWDAILPTLKKRI